MPRDSSSLNNVKRSSFSVSKYSYLANARAFFLDSFRLAAKDAGCDMQEEPRDLPLLAGTRKPSLDTELKGAMTYTPCEEKELADKEKEYLKEVFPVSWSSE